MLNQMKKRYYVETNVYIKLMHIFPLIHRFKWINHTKTDGPAKYSKLLRLKNGGCFSDEKILTFRNTAGLLVLKVCYPCELLFENQIHSSI